MVGMARGAKIPMSQRTKKNVKNLQENLKLDALLYKVFDKNI